jgi:hypothetical protein
MGRTAENVAGFRKFTAKGLFELYQAAGAGAEGGGEDADQAA